MCSLVTNIEAEEILIVAHRGASAYAPENTLPAFELAWELNADAIEGDFHLTADGEIVCVHDFSIEKYTGIDRRVNEMKLEELRALDFGVWKGHKWQGTAIPTLAEVLATVPLGKRIFVEVKCGPEIVPELLERVEESELEQDQVVFISFEENVIERLKTEAPEYVANWLVSLEVDGEGNWKPSLAELKRVLKKTGADGISTRAIGELNERWVSSFKEEGWGYHVWTVDDPIFALKLVDIGVQTVTTNRPDVILKALEDKR